MNIKLLKIKNWYYGKQFKQIKKRNLRNLISGFFNYNNLSQVFVSIYTILPIYFIS